MTTKDPNDSVQNEQFDSVESSVENAEEKVSSDEVKEEVTESVQEVKKTDKSKLEKELAAEASEQASDNIEQISEEMTGPAAPAKEDQKEEMAPEEEKAEPETKPEPEAKPEDLPQVDYSNRSRADLVETLDILLENRPPGEIRNDVEKIKILFYKKYKVEVEEIKSKFIADGGADEDFKPPVDELENMMKKLLSKYRGRRAEYSKQFEIEKQENLKRKYEIIDQIKDLVNREESINITFQEFRDLQNEWYNLGAVPQSSLKNLWETYNHNVEIFYDYIKINKELRDLDFKKNQELKLALCEKAEELISSTNTVGSFRTLQEFHQRWREIGPVPREERNQLWERFKEATSQVNKKHHEYFEKQKDDQRKNMEAKTALCEKIEAILELKTSSFRDWEERAKEVIQLQKDWRKIGFAPKRHNTSIYTRFREGCDKFFQAKRDFYAANKEVQLKNLELKTKLCEKAEELQNSTDWKVTTEEFIKLQKSWKDIGSVPRKNSDKIWKRFRKACDNFFNKKSEFYSEADSSFEDNLKLKEELINKLENFEPGNDLNAAFEELKAIQGKWNSIGYVPFKKKDEVANNYRMALNKQFDKFKIDEDQKAIIKYQNKLENLKENPKASRKLRTERDRFIIRIKQLESDIVTWENNIGFFSKSSNADSMIKEVEDKIENAHKTIEMLEEKVKMIDKSGLDD